MKITKTFFKKKIKKMINPRITTWYNQVNNRLLSHIQLTLCKYLKTRLYGKEF